MAFVDHIDDEVAAADIMGEVAEVLVAKWVVAHVLNQRPSIGEGVRFLQILWSRCWESLGQQWLNVILPKKIDNFFVGEHRIGAANLGPPMINPKAKQHVQEMGIVS